MNEVLLSNVAKVLIRMLSLLPINKNKILYSSYRGAYFNDNPRAIYEALKKYNPNIRHVWLLNDHSDEYTGVQCKYYSLRSIYELATSAIWIDNCRKGNWVYKRKKQIYIQTWHGGIALKKIERDAIGNLPEGYEEMAIHDSRMTDYYISPAKWCTNLYKNSFWYNNGRILETGYPRSDVLYKDSISVSEAVREKYGIGKSNVVLYAPTFRADGGLKNYDIDFKRMLSTLETTYGGTWKCIVRLHPNLKELTRSIEFNDFVLDGSKIEDINALIVACDLFISDFSSCMFDAMEAGKNVILYIRDYLKYQEDRGMYFTLEELPFPIAQSNDELNSTIQNKTYDFSKVKRFKENLGIVRSDTSSEEVANIVLKLMDE